MADQLHFLDQGITPKINIKEKEYLYFSGTSYLGMTLVSEFIDSIAQNLKKWGSNHGQSRLNNIRLGIYEEFESFFSQQAGAEDAAVVSSGYLAGIAINQVLAGEFDEIWISPDAHSAILPEGKQTSNQLNFTQWKKQCFQRSKELNSSKILIIGNTVDAFTAQVHDYTWVKEIAQTHDVTLLIDDSHAFGVLGDKLFGTYSQWNDPSFELIVCGSLGKGLAVPAGIILGDRSRLGQLKNTPLYGGASPGSPAHLAAFLECQDLIQNQQGILFQNCAQFDQAISEISAIEGNRDYPVFRLLNDCWAKELEERGFIISSFRYPTAESNLVNRIIISAFHKSEDIEQLTHTLNQLKSHEI
ncbi:aminotransferase class I/II-fold pyridoxal phosphate-dependent enzyme [Algoriphagus vanfongensis]|uniref:aminotransferase class I/II-fold pyridoxal phosphate-dependent enzyme n=1 Tax=Algoriphagus vanfongensis TaxID=426371 RepID=UPI000424CB0D|nr:aminotransferase class I/II-fold pyridoxal phosphate-dependent enzyme [Algoriphagus vanfongensis]